MSDASHVDLIVIGAGPAGLSAAATAARSGLEVTVIDESPRPGGRLLGQLHQKPGKDGAWWNGIEVAADLVREAEAAGVAIELETAVWDVQPGFDVFGTRHGEQRRWSAPRVLIATGAAEAAVPVPGWDRPGVMSIGGAQVLANVHRVTPGECAIVVGINVLSVAIARELSMAGVEVVGLVLPPPGTISGSRADPSTVIKELLALSHLAPSPWIRTVGPKMAEWGLHRIATRFFPRSGFRLWGIPIRPTVAVTRIHGADGVTGVELAHLTTAGDVIASSKHDIDVDVVCIAGGLYPLVELPNAAGCLTYHDDDLGGHVPLHDHGYRSTKPGLYVAGNVTGIEGAEVAMAQGRAVGYAIAHDHTQDPEHLAEFERAQANVVETRHAADIRFIPTIERGRASMAEVWSRFASDRRTT